MSFIFQTSIYLSIYLSIYVTVYSYYILFISICTYLFQSVSIYQSIYLSLLMSF